LATIGERWENQQATGPPGWAELVQFVGDTRESVEVLAAATEANATVFAELMRVVRELRTSTDARANLAQRESETLAQLVDSIRELPVVATASPNQQVDTEALAELSTRVGELQRAVAESPLEALMKELVISIRALRDTVEELPAATVAPAVEPVDLDLSPMLDEFVTVVRTMQAGLAEEIGELREDIVKLKRRVALRTAATEVPPAGLGEAEIERIVAALVARLETALEIVPDD
jgi:hypothetical protein